MGRIVAITGARAGVGRATAEEFARRGWDVGLLARDQQRLDAAAAELRQRYGVRTVAVATDVADAAAVEAAASRIEAELGPIEVWVNVAMATVFAPVKDITPAEFKRATEVTYLGQVYGTMAALKRMRTRNRGTIVNVGSALAYRSVPLQAAYCGAKFAIRGFTNSLRSEIIHDKLDVHLTEVDLPAVNTPQFEWALNKTGKQAQPVPPIYQPEVPARAIYFAATHRRRQIWVGFPTVRAIFGEPGRAGTDRPLSGHGRLQRPAYGRAASKGRAEQSVRAGGGRFRRARPVRCAGSKRQLGNVYQPPSNRVLGCRVRSGGAWRRSGRAGTAAVLTSDRPEGLDISKQQQIRHASPSSGRGRLSNRLQHPDAAPLAPLRAGFGPLRLALIRLHPERTLSQRFLSGTGAAGSGAGGSGLTRGGRGGGGGRMAGSGTTPSIRHSGRSRRPTCGAARISACVSGSFSRYCSSLP